MAANPQLQSAFITRLPRELRDLIYLELWRSSGLRQHIVRHYTLRDKKVEHVHFCRWPCRTDFQVEDGLQQDIDTLRRQLDLDLPETFDPNVYIADIPSYRRLRSPWLNHWACGEYVEEVCESDDVTSAISTFVIQHPPPCQRRIPTNPSSYIPMLLSCKIISAECKKSIYESTTFIFTDMMTFQIFVGHCKEPTLAVENRSQPNIRFPQPVLLEHVRHLELSLPPSFEHALPCSSSSFPGETIKAEDLHDAFDFHWLRLDKFQNLRSINIWMAARAMLMHYVPPNSRDPVFVSITSLNIESLRRPLASFGGSFEVTLSMPLHKDITPEDGFVEGIAPSNVRLWKRGSGDQYHPLMLPSGPGGIWYGKIFAAQRRQLNVGGRGLF